MVLKPRQINCVRILLTAFLFVQVSSALFSQSTVSGIVKDKDDAPVEFANVLLLNQPDLGPNVSQKLALKFQIKK